MALRLGAVYADNSLRTRRSVSLPGLSETETARFGGPDDPGLRRTGLPLCPFHARRGAFRETGSPPRRAVLHRALHRRRLFHLGQDRFQETGGAAALRGLGRDNDIGTVTAGLRAQTEFDLGVGAPVAAHGLLGYRRAFGDVVPAALLAFQAGPPS